MSEPRFNAELDIHLDGGRTATQNRTAPTANETIYIIALNENRAKEVFDFEYECPYLILLLGWFCGNKPQKSSGSS